MPVKPVIIPLVADTTGLEPGIDALESLGKIDADVANQFRAANKAFQERGKVLDQSVTSSEKFVAASKKLVESITGGAIAQATANIKKFTDQVDSTNAEFITLTKTIALAKQELSKLQQGTPSFDKLSQEIEAAEIAMGNFQKEATSSRTQLRQYREALQQLEDKGLESTAVFNDLAISAAQLEDQIGDTQARIKALASDTFKFDAAIQAVQGLAGAFSIAQGAAALLGSENDDLQKALLKVQAAMAILNGLQQLQNLLQSQSSVSIAASIALQKVAVLQTNLQAATESRFIIVRYAAVAAQRVLNAVMAANPAGVVLFAIAALATALVAFTSNTDKAAEAQKKMNQDLETFIKLSELSAKVVQQGADVRLATLEKERASSQQIREAETQALRDQVSIAKSVYDKATENLKQATKEERDQRQAQIDYLRKSGVSEAAIQNAISKQTNKYTEERVKAAQMQFDAGQKYFDLENQLQVKRLQNQKSAEDESLKSATAAAQARIAEATRGSTAELQAQINAIRVGQQEQLKASELTEGERKKIIAENERTIADLRLQIQQKNYDDQIALAESKSLEQRDLFRKLQAGTEVIILKAARETLGKDKEQATLIETQKNEAILALRKQLFGDLETLNIQHLQRNYQGEIEILNKTAKEEVASYAKTAQERLLFEQQKAQERIDLTEREEEAKKQLRIRSVETSIQVASSLAQSLTDIAKNNADAQIAIEQQRLDQGLITQEQFDQRSRAIRRKAAQDEKQLALFQAALAQSLAILSVLKDQTIPPTAKPLFIALASAQALAQLAAIASKPIPQFAKGTKNAPGGLSLIGEAGPELYYSGGKWGYASRATMLDLPKGSKVIPTLETEKILQKYNIPMPNVSEHVNTTYAGMKIDYKKLGAVIGKEIGRLPLQYNNWDERGFSSYQTSINNRSKHLKTKFSSGK